MMTDAHEDVPGPPVAAIVKVAERTQSIGDEATINVIFKDDQMINDVNLNAVVTTYIRVAQLDKDEDSGAAFAITAEPTQKTKLEAIYTPDGMDPISLSSSNIPQEIPLSQDGKPVSCVTYSMLPVTEDELDSLRALIIARAEQIRLASEFENLGIAETVA